MWDAFQREVLGAMGHALLVPTAAPAAEPAPAVVPAAEPAWAAAHAAVAVDISRPALLQALALAAGVDATRLVQLGVLPPLAALHTPTAKRGLWPRLRRLRSGQRP